MQDVINTARIRELNDLCRTAMGIGGKLIQTQSICSLPQEDQQDRDEFLPEAPEPGFGENGP